MKDLFKAYRKVEDFFVLAERVERMIKPMTMCVPPVMNFAKAQAQLVRGVNERVVGGGGTGGGTTSGSTGATGASTKSVATGGTRSTNITINLKSLVEKIVFNGGVAENGKAMADQVAQYMLQALNMAQASVG